MIDDKRTSLNYAEAVEPERMGVAIVIMFGMAVLCAINLGSDFLLIIAPRIGDSPSDFVTGVLVLIFLLGFVAAFVGTIAFIASKKSRSAYFLMAIFLITLLANCVIVFIASQVWVT